MLGKRFSGQQSPCGTSKDQGGRWKQTPCTKLFERFRCSVEITVRSDLGLSNLFGKV